MDLAVTVSLPSPQSGLANRLGCTHVLNLSSVTSVHPGMEGPSTNSYFLATRGNHHTHHYFSSVSRIAPIYVTHKMCVITTINHIFPRCYLQPDNHSPAGLVPDMSSLGTSVLWKPHGNVIQSCFDDGTNHLITEEDIKWCVACWSMKKLLKPGGAGGPSFAGYEGVAVTVNNQVGCVQRGCW